MTRPLILLTLLLLTSPIPASFAADPAPPAPQPAALDQWPQWRGPLCTGVAPSAHPPTTWSESQNIKWKLRLPGSGTSTPIVWQDKIFIQTAIPTGRAAPATQASAPTTSPSTLPAATVAMLSPTPSTIYQFVLLCIDRQTGKILWQKIAAETVPHEPHHADHGYASYSPVTDGQRILAYFGSRGLHCYDMSGQLLWEKDLGLMKTKMTFGEGSSPALFANTVVVNWDHEAGSFIAAFDLQTGRELWRQPRDETTSWSTPLIVQHGDSTQVIVAATRKIRSYNLADGNLIWQGPGLTINAIPSPVSADGIVYLTSGFRGNALLAIRLGSTGDLEGTNAILWKYNKNTPYIPSPLLSGQRLYFFSGNNPILSCFDSKTGQPHYTAQPIDGLEGVYASPVAADNKVYLLGRNGATVVIKDAPTYEVLATNQLTDHFDASPALAGKDLLLRGRLYLYCLSQP